MSEDLIIDAIDNVQCRAVALHEALDRTVEALMTARQERVAGAPLVEIVTGFVERGGITTRRSVDEAFRAYTAAITAYRAEAVRALVDHGAMTLSEVARLVGVSRQMVSRLYRAGHTRDVDIVRLADRD